MHVRKAVITAAGPDQRQLPLQTLVDRDGAAKSALRILLDEAARAGVEEIGVVVHPADRERYAAAAGDPGPRLAFVPQSEARGYAHALVCARDFVGDHLWIASGERGAAQELVAVAESETAAVSAVQSTRESHLKLYGAIGGTRISGRGDLYEIDAVIEKPTPTEAEQKLFVPGLRAGHYLCFFGMHVLPASIFRHIDLELAAAAPARPSLSGALARLLGKEKWLACEVNARRFNLGEKYGLLTAQLALGLAGKDRDDVLTQLTDLLAQRGRATSA